MHVTTFSQLKLNPPEHNLPVREKTHWKKSSILEQGKSCVLPIILTSFLHAKLITFQWIQVTDNDLADRWLGITRQEGRIEGPKCLSTGSHLFPSLTLWFFHPFPKQGACSQATSRLASHTSPVEVELFFSIQTLFFVTINLQVLYTLIFGYSPFVHLP